MKAPALWYLAGLTCTEDTGPWKGAFLRDAAEEGLAVIFPDTSPREAGVKGEKDDWEVGVGECLPFMITWASIVHKICICGFVGAGYYLNATQKGWEKHYNMSSLIVDELPRLIQAANLPIVRLIQLKPHSASQ